MTMPDIRFARSGDVHIAYQVLGQGPPDLVWIHDWISNIELQWDSPENARYLNGLASMARLLLFDKRGSGLSDRTVDQDLFTLEVRMDDVRAVMDAAGSREAVIFGSGDDGGSLAAMFAATYPERTRGLILYGARAKGMSSDDYPHGYTAGVPDMWGTETENFWATDAYARRYLALLAPSLANDDRVVRWYSRLLRQSSSPGTEREFERATVLLDLRGMLSAIHVPTLVLHRAGDTDVPVEAGRDLAERIAGSRFVSLPGIDPYPWAGDQDPLLEEVRSFVTGSSSASGADRVLATVLFTDIVDSTARAAAIGDREFRQLRADHDALIRAALESFRGVEIETAGDSFLATFDGPARAVRCAEQINRGVRDLGIETRAGVHTGEVELVADGIRGIAVHISARVAALAGPGEVLVTQTVKDLVAGSGLAFDDTGEHELKGVPDRWRLWRVVS